MALKSDLIFEKLFGPADELLRVEGGVAELGMHDEPVGQQQGHPGDVLRVFPGAVVPLEQLLDDEVAELVVDVQHLVPDVLIAETGGGQDLHAQGPFVVVPVEDIHEQTVHGDVLRQVVHPGDELLLLLPEMPLDEVEEDVLFGLVMVVQRTLGNAAGFGDGREGDRRDSGLFHEFRRLRENDLFHVVAAWCCHEVNRPF